MNFLINEVVKYTSRPEQSIVFTCIRDSFLDYFVHCCANVDNGGPIVLKEIINCIPSRKTHLKAR